MLAFHKHHVWFWFIVSCIWSKHAGWDCGDGGLFVSVMSSNILIFNYLTQKYTDQQIALTPNNLDYIKL